MARQAFASTGVVKRAKKRLIAQILQSNLFHLKYPDHKTVPQRQQPSLVATTSVIANHVCPVVEISA